ncbi:MAG TPA: DNA polymerase I [Candidatus Sulfotelmatobacter sp.]|nr:DNA polymerase I [Candidatus Sulfotelmatobacter sp.]
MPRLFVLDALGLAYRSYYAFVRRPLLNSRGENTSAIFGVANLVLKIRREERPDYWALAWDGPGPTFRHQRYPDYKATRKPMPDDLRSQLTPIEDMAQALGLPVLEIPGTEADDVMATLAHRGASEGLEVVLVTGDKDMLQAVEDHVRVYAPAQRGEDWVKLDAAGVRAKWGVGPEHIRDVLALMGDTTDNIPGVPGVGEKTAVELMHQFGSLEALYSRLGEVKRPALREKLEQHRGQAFLSRELATVRHDLDLGLSWEQLRCAPIRREPLLAFARQFEVRRLETVAREEGVDESAAGALAPARPAERRGTAAETEAEGVKLLGQPDATSKGPAPPGKSEPPRGQGAEAGAAAAEVPGEAAELFEPAGAAPPLPPPLFARPASASATWHQPALDLWGGATAVDPAAWLPALHEVRARAIHGLGILPIAEGDPRTARMIGLALSARDGTACYLPLAHEAGGNLEPKAVRELLSPALADSSVPKVSDDLKRVMHLMKGAQLPFEGLAFDLHVGSFLLDAVRDHSLEALAHDVLGVTLPDLEPPAARGRPRPSRAAADPAALGESAARHAATLFPLADALRTQLEAREQWGLYARLEHPLIPVLADMERAGVRLDAPVLSEMSGQCAARIAELESALYALAGEPLNLQSGAQVAQVLFEKFKLKPGRRTKTGFSTDEAVLEELAAEHPFPKLLLEYRALTKLRSTYLEALPAAVDPRDGRVHTRFEQTGAATGRLSSSNPNLQNIPMRTEQGRAIRRAFVAPEGGVLIGADYSQIELRVMAHLSGDPNLIEAFQRGGDIHAETARRIFGVTGELDPTLRARAKVVNFGVMYGMGARSLSQQMGIGLEEAQLFIADYFRVYARVREYLDATVEDARRVGYVQTLLGRRRYLPGLASVHGAERSFAERAAINAPIQGSAADLMKLAMIRVHRSLGSRSGARLLLQVHDELLLECPAADGAAVSERVKREMESCYTLRVPLVVSVGMGRSWFDVH